MSLQLFAALPVLSAKFQMHVSSWFLLYQQTEIGCHQVNTSLYSQFLTDERRLQDHRLTIVFFQQFYDGLFEVGNLFFGTDLKVLLLEIITYRIFQRILFEIVLQHRWQRHVRMVDDIIKGSTRKAT